MYISQGHEPRAFGVRHPRELYPPHASLICQKLDGETPFITLYFPVWEGGNGIWGHENPHASVAVCLSEKHWFISLHFHERQISRLYRVAHDRIFTVETGKALLVAWLHIRFEENGHVRSLNILFNSHIFARVKRLVWVWRFFYTNPSLAKEIGRLAPEKGPDIEMLPNEKIIAHFPLAPVFKKKKRGSEVLAHKSLLQVTSDGFLLFSVQESAADVGQLTFAEAFHAWPLQNEKAPLRILPSPTGWVLTMDRQQQRVVEWPLFYEQMDEATVKRLQEILKAF